MLPLPLSLLPLLLLLLLLLSLLPLATAFSSVYTPLHDGSFERANGTLYHNRPLYGPHTSLLVLAGDRPLVHVCEDRILFGGLLLGLVSGQKGVWAHEADDVLSTFVPGTFEWEVRDSSLPGLSLSARVLPAATGQGAVLDVNVTSDAGAAGPAEFVWAFGCGTTPSSGNALGWLYDPLLNNDVLTWTFTPEDCAGNRITLNTTTNTSYEVAFASTVVTVTVVSSAAGPTSLVSANATDWEDIVGLGVGAESGRRAQSPEEEEEVSSSSLPSTPPHPTPAARADALPVPGATFWLRAASLSGTLANNTPVSTWPDESGVGGQDVSQATPSLQPLFVADGLAPGEPGVRFDGASTFLANPSVPLTSTSTLLAVFRDEGSTGGSGSCCSGIIFFQGAFNGLATRATSQADDDDSGGSQSPVIMTLDYAGSATYGHTNVHGRTVFTSTTYTAGGPSTFEVDGCSQGSTPTGGSAGLGVMVGTRNNELGRFFKGLIGELVVFPRALSAAEMASMQAYFAATYPASLRPKKSCGPTGGGLPVSRTPVQPAATTRFTVSIVASSSASPSPPPSDPLADLADADARVAANTGVSASTPDPLISGALKSMGAAVDGLYRASPPVFVHGAMAWDVPYVGWRSEMGATALGRSSLVAGEGAYYIATQDTTSPRDAPCQSDPARLGTIEASSSRFYGRGRITANQGMYDMQSQLFDQQIHMWRWTGNVTHEPLLRSALALHVELAGDAYDGDGDGLYAAYINTWPTDSVWYNGGATAEETAYVYTAAKALRDMATRAGNATEAGVYAALMAKIEAALPNLWVAEEGHYAAFREEGGHRRLRPDAWLYAVFLPIHAGLATPEEAAQALYYTEWGLERDVMQCPTTESGGMNETCGVVVWTSNWVPSQWSVRQLWGGDNMGLALAYFLAGLPDDGYSVLRGTLSWNMLLESVPGQAGSANGGTDFNDCVHPTTVALVSGLFGYAPDYISGVVTVSPQFPSTWPNASLSVPDVSLVYSAPEGGTSASLSVTLTAPAPTLVLRLPLRAQGYTGVAVTGLVPASATYTSVVEAGFGQSVVVVTVTAASPQALVAEATMTVTWGAAGGPSGPLPYVPSLYLNLTEGQAAPVVLAPPAGLALVNVSDPQGVFVPGSLSLVNGTATGTLSPGVTAGHRLVVGYAATTSPSALPQRLLFKIAVAASGPAVPHALSLGGGAGGPDALASSSSWGFVPVPTNGDVTAIYKAGTYTSPRPETCAVRIGTDGWSAWTFTYWGGPGAPSPDFSNVANMTVAPGVIQTSQGARFLLPNATAGARNIAFTSLWDAYPSAVNVSVPAALLPGATTAWALVAGSTNPMQTRLANAALRFVYSDGTVEELDLVPPKNFWSLSGWGTGDYSYETDAFTLPAIPPPAVQLGASNRAMVYAHPLAPGKSLVGVQLETLSQEVVIGLLAVSLMAPA
jgi:hypothetical protein